MCICAYFAFLWNFASLLLWATFEAVKLSSPPIMCNSFTLSFEKNVNINIFIAFMLMFDIKIRVLQYCQYSIFSMLSPC